MNEGRGGVAQKCPWFILVKNFFPGSEAKKATTKSGRKWTTNDQRRETILS
jgi:hypothetical protein